MNLLKVAARIAASPAKVKVGWFENLPPEDMAQEIAAFSQEFPGSVWVSWYFMGWIVSTVDPSALGEDPIEIQTSGISLKATTYSAMIDELCGDKEANEEVSPPKQYGSFLEFAKTADCIMYCVSHESEEVDPYIKGLNEAGASDLAKYVDSARKTGELDDVGFN